MPATPLTLRKRRPPAGSRPGSLVIPKNSPPPKIRVMDFDRHRLTECSIEDLDELNAYLDRDTITWIDIQGMGDEATIRGIGEIFGLHALVLEDLVNVPQRPKFEEYDEYCFATARMMQAGTVPDVDIEQIGLLLFPSVVVTVQERYGDVLDPVRERIRRGGGPIRVEGADYVAYAILDAILDGYYPVLEGIGDHIEGLEQEVMARPDPSVLRSIHDSKRALLLLRRALWPQREALNAMVRADSGAFSESVKVYLRDCYDHVVQMIDVVETYRELAGGLMDVYLSSMSNRMNEIMKVLTILSSIFIPLTFIAGIYGMNFEYMPELHSPWAYPAIIALMLVIAIGMVAYFRAQGWLGARSDKS